MTSECVEKSTPTNEVPGHQTTPDLEVVQNKSTAIGAPVGTVGAKRQKSTKVVSKRKKSKVLEEPEEPEEEVATPVYTPHWEVYEDDTLFGSSAEGRKVDPVELLKGICLPKDKKKLSLHKTSDGIPAVAQLLAKVSPRSIIFFHMIIPFSV